MSGVTDNLRWSVLLRPSTFWLTICLFHKHTYLDTFKNKNKKHVLVPHSPNSSASDTDQSPTLSFFGSFSSLLLLTDRIPTSSSSPTSSNGAPTTRRLHANSVEPSILFKTAFIKTTLALFPHTALIEQQNEQASTHSSASLYSAPWPPLPPSTPKVVRDASTPRHLRGARGSPSSGQLA